MKKKMLKRVLGTMLVGVMLTGMVAGCGKEDAEDSTGTGSSAVDSESGENEDSKQEESGEAWKKLDFTLGGAKLVIPCTYEEFKESGYVLAKEDEDFVMDRKGYRSDLKATNANGDEILITVSNPTKGEERTVAEGYVVEMEVNAYKDYSNITMEQNLDFTLWDNYKIGDSIENFKKITNGMVNEYDALDKCTVNLEGVNAGIEGIYGDIATFKFIHGTGEFVGIRINRFGEYM